MKKLQHHLTTLTRMELSLEVRPLHHIVEPRPLLLIVDYLHTHLHRSSIRPQQLSLLQLCLLPLPPPVVEPVYRSRLRLELPTFSGDMLEWREFWHLFSARMEREPGLSQVEKIGCLESSMASTEAREIIRYASITGQYDDVVDALKGHYDKLKLVNKHHVSQLLSLCAIGDDHESLVLLKRKLTMHIGEIQACHGASFEQFITALVETRLGCNDQQLWADYSAEHSSSRPSSSSWIEG